MSNNPLRSRQVQDPLKREFEARKDGGKLLQWTAKRFPWIHVLSCSGLCPEGYDELGNITNGKALSLFGTNPGQAAYDSFTKLSYPIITGLDVTAMGSLGTTRKAVVKLTCFSDDQLIELQKCYFIPGMDVRVQWGWGVSCDGSVPPPLLTNKEEDPITIVCKINKRRKDHSNYDGFQGVVANFKYSLTKENTWDCEIEVISAADPFSESKVGNTVSRCPREVEIDGEESIKDYGPIYAALSDMHNEGSKAISRIFSELKKNTKDTTHHYIVSWQYEGVNRTETGSDTDGSWYDGIFGGEETTEVWISFGAFIDGLNMMSIPNNGEGGYPLGKVDINNVTLNAPKRSIIASQILIDSLATQSNLSVSDTTALLSARKEIFAMSADPRVCYIPGGALNFKDFSAYIQPGYTEAPSAIVIEDNVEKVQLAKIMCNTAFLLKHYKQVYDGDGKLSTLIQNILDEINKVCGRPWTLLTISTEDDCGTSDAGNKTGPTITILDEKQVMELEEPYSIPSTVGDSTLRSFSLDMKMTGAMKTQAVYAGNSQKSKGGKGDDSTACAGVSAQSFYVGGRNAQGGNLIKNLAKPDTSDLTVSDGNCEESDNVAKNPTFQELINKFYWEVNDQTVGAMQTYLDNAISEYDPDTCAGTPLPFDFNFTVDGISGFEFGQMVTSNRIPKEVEKVFRWQVTKVEHKITPNDWETSISTICRANPTAKQTQGGQAKS